ncbi:MAG: EAL domain-containing protein [Oscillospiraceae bacterium]|nr:EAL domain-containing protein [Oscillospiraceae bacterium]
MKITPEIVQEVINKKDIFVEFQPIYSINTKKVIGLEALARGDYQGEIVSPYFLFNYAKQSGNVLELDRICREKSMDAFVAERKTAPALFVNFETSVLNDTTVGDGELLGMVERYNLSPESVVIELNSSDVKNNYDLMMFVNHYRSKGFLIALDNVSAGEDTMNRIKLVNPDIIKIDRFVVSNIESNTYNQEVFKSIINTAKQIGAMTIAQGVENVDEVITCMLMGVDYFQGYYFSRPEQFNFLFTNEARLKLEDAAQRLNLSIKKNPTVVNVRIESYKRAIYDLVSALTGTTSEDYEKVLRSYVYEHKEIECAFLIDEKGFQITETIMNPDTEIIPGFKPELKGVNHDIKNYFYAVKEQIEDPFISGWYISAATGKNCKTISSHIYDSEGKMIVVCMDLKKR